MTTRQTIAAYLKEQGWHYHQSRDPVIDINIEFWWKNPLKPPLGQKHIEHNITLNETTAQFTTIYKMGLPSDTDQTTVAYSDPQLFEAIDTRQ